MTLEEKRVPEAAAAMTGKERQAPERNLEPRQNACVHMSMLRKHISGASNNFTSAPLFSSNFFLCVYLHSHRHLISIR